MTEDAMTRTAAGAANKRRAALGRGLGALLGDVRREEPVGGDTSGERAGETVNGADGLAMIAVSSVVPHPENPRTYFDEDALNELAASISARGLIQPIIVRPKGGERYELVAGERRWRAAQIAQVHEIPAIIRDLGDGEVAALALIENIQREDLNPLEEARAYQRLSQKERLGQAEIATLVDKSRSHVANLMRLLSLPEPVQAMVETGALSMGHARALVNCAEAEAIARDAVSKNLSVRQVEKKVRQLANGDGTPSRRAARAPRQEQNADILAMQAHLEEFLGLPVRIDADDDPRSGSVTIRYKTLDQLDLVCQRLSGGEI